MVDTHQRSPIKRRRILSTSDSLMQEYMSLRTRYTALVTTTSQYIKFISEALKRLQDEEKQMSIKRMQSATSSAMDSHTVLHSAKMQDKLHDQSKLLEALTQGKDQAEEEARSLQLQLSQQQNGHMVQEDIAPHYHKELQTEVDDPNMHSKSVDVSRAPTDVLRQHFDCQFQTEGHTIHNLDEKDVHQYSFFEEDLIIRELPIKPEAYLQIGLSDKSELENLHKALEKTEKEKLALIQELHMVKEDILAISQQNVLLQQQLGKVKTPVRLEAASQTFCNEAQKTISKDDPDREETYVNKLVMEIETKSFQFSLDEAMYQPQKKEDQKRCKLPKSEKTLADHMAIIEETCIFRDQTEQLLQKNLQDIENPQKVMEEIIRENLLEDKASQSQKMLRNKIGHLKHLSKADIQEQKKDVEDTLSQNQKVAEEIILKLELDKVTKEKRELQEELYRLRKTTDEFGSITDDTVKLADNMEPKVQRKHELQLQRIKLEGVMELYKKAEEVAKNEILKAEAAGEKCEDADKLACNAAMAEKKNELRKIQLEYQHLLEQLQEDASMTLKASELSFNQADYLSGCFEDEHHDLDLISETTIKVPLQMSSDSQNIFNSLEKEKIVIEAERKLMKEEVDKAKHCQKDAENKLKMLYKEVEDLRKTVTVDHKSIASSLHDDSLTAKDKPVGVEFSAVWEKPFDIKEKCEESLMQQRILAERLAVEKEKAVQTVARLQKEVQESSDRCHVLAEEKIRLEDRRKAGENNLEMLIQEMDAENESMQKELTCLRDEFEKARQYKTDIENELLRVKWELDQHHLLVLYEQGKMPATEDVQILKNLAEMKLHVKKVEEHKRAVEEQLKNVQDKAAREIKHRKDIESDLEKLKEEFEHLRQLSRFFQESTAEVTTDGSKMSEKDFHVQTLLEETEKQKRQLEDELKIVKDEAAKAGQQYTSIKDRCNKLEDEVACLKQKGNVRPQSKPLPQIQGAQGHEEQIKTCEEIQSHEELGKLKKQSLEGRAQQKAKEECSEKEKEKALQEASRLRVELKEAMWKCKNLEEENQLLLSFREKGDAAPDAPLQDMHVQEKSFGSEPKWLKDEGDEAKQNKNELENELRKLKIELKQLKENNKEGKARLECTVGQEIKERIVLHESEHGKMEKQKEGLQEELNKVTNEAAQVNLQYQKSRVMIKCDSKQQPNQHKVTSFPLEPVAEGTAKSSTRLQVQQAVKELVGLKQHAEEALIHERELSHRLAAEKEKALKEANILKKEVQGAAKKVIEEERAKMSARKEKVGNWLGFLFQETRSWHLEMNEELSQLNKDVLQLAKQKREVEAEIEKCTKEMEQNPQPKARKQRGDASNPIKRSKTLSEKCLAGGNVQERKVTLVKQLKEIKDRVSVLHHHKVHLENELRDIEYALEYLKRATRPAEPPEQVAEMHNLLDKSEEEKWMMEDELKCLRKEAAKVSKGGAGVDVDIQKQEINRLIQEDKLAKEDKMLFPKDTPEKCTVNVEITTCNEQYVKDDDIKEKLVKHIGIQVETFESAMKEQKFEGKQKLGPGEDELDRSGSQMQEIDNNSTAQPKLNAMEASLQKKDEENMALTEKLKSIKAEAAKDLAYTKSIENELNGVKEELEFDKEQGKPRIPSKMSFAMHIDSSGKLHKAPMELQLRGFVRELKQELKEAVAERKATVDRLETEKDQALQAAGRLQKEVKKCKECCRVAKEEKVRLESKWKKVESQHQALLKDADEHKTALQEQIKQVQNDVAESSKQKSSNEDKLAKLQKEFEQQKQHEMEEMDRLKKKAQKGSYEKNTS
uniref:Uncharacterized protein n=1 Tax=Eptatretus burgeri TaxID=7764 RepID=A0A8C4WUJ6_EPTBU